MRPAPTKASAWPFAGWLASRGGLLLLGLLIPAFLIVASAAVGPAIPAAALAIAVAIYWTVRDLRFGICFAVLFATFVDYGTGRLTLTLSLLLGWVVFLALLLWWRGSWKAWRPLPGEVALGVAVWAVVNLLGAVHGILRGNSLRYGGLELFAAGWPLVAWLVAQRFGRCDLPAAALGLAGIALCHAAFGLAALKVFQQRVGGVYFTTVTGIVAVTLWSVAFLSPSRRVTFACLGVMVPLLLHLLFSFTRGYWLGFLAGILLAAILAWRVAGKIDLRQRSKRLAVLAGFLAVLGLTMGLSVLYLGQQDLFESVSERFATSFETHATGETASNLFRLVEYDEAIRTGWRSPVFGWGLGATIVMRDPIFGGHEDHWFIHNYYLQTWVKLGLPGLLALALLVWQTVALAWRMMTGDPDPWVKMWAIGVIAATADVLVISVTNYPLANVNTGFLLALIWGALWGTRADRVSARQA